MRVLSIAMTVTIGAALAAALVACPPSGAPRPIPPSPAPGSGYQPPATTPPVDAGAVADHPGDGDDGDDAVAGAPAGATCVRDADCASRVCEGQGCGPDQPGTCAERQPMCTAVMSTWCGCDGVTFETTSGCPGRRFAHRGAC